MTMSEAASETACWPAPPSRRLFLGLVALFMAVGLVLGLPGADGDAANVFNVITRLAEEHRYALSRTPGQPFLDGLNFLTWTAFGELGVQAWFVLVSAAGITALYRFLRSAGAAAPLLGALAVGVHPLFLGHVGGLGDFAASLAFLLLALRAGQLGLPLLAGVLVGLCSGCRLPYVVFAIPVAALVPAGPGVWRRRAGTVLSAGVVCSLFYMPLLVRWGPALLRNFSESSSWTLGYRVSAFSFRLLISFGVPFWLLVGALAIVAVRKQAFRGYRPSPTDLAAMLTAALGALILSRVPTKPELTLPILLGLTIFVSVHTGRTAQAALLGCAVLSGMVLLSPYNRDSGRHAWHLESGHYAKIIEQAHDSRLMARTVPETLNQLPGGAVLVSSIQWTLPQARVAAITEVRGFDDVPGLVGYRFGAAPGRTLVSFQDEKLKPFLERRRARGEVYFDPRLQGMLRRWVAIEIADYARPAVVGGSPLGRLLSVAGLSSTAVAAIAR